VFRDPPDARRPLHARTLLAVLAAALLVLWAAPADAGEVETFVKDSGKAVLAHPSRLQVASLTLPVIKNIGECYAAATVVKKLVEIEAPEAKHVADRMIKCKDSIGDAIVEVAADDAKHYPALLALMKGGQDVEELVLVALARDVGKNVGSVEARLKALEKDIIKAVVDEVVRLGLREAKKAAAYVEHELLEDERAAAVMASKLPSGARRDLALAHNAERRVAHQAEVDAQRVGRAVAQRARRSWSHLRSLF
jgi:hypothetical protein